MEQYKTLSQVFKLQQCQESVSQTLHYININISYELKSLYLFYILLKYLDILIYITTQQNAIKLYIHVCGYVNLNVYV